jgi:hypothetical protein
MVLLWVWFGLLFWFLVGFLWCGCGFCWWFWVVFVLIVGFWVVDFGQGKPDFP